MYRDATDLPNGALLRGYDICIVGAGAAGLAMAKRLNGASVSVLLLASGSPEDRGTPPEHAQSVYRGTVGPFLEKVDPIFPERSRLRMYGGTTNHFGFWARPLDAVDFHARPGYRDTAWPIDLDTLTPYYRDAHRFGNFGPFRYDDLDFWEPLLYARCFDAGGQAPVRGGTMHAQYDEPTHDFQVQLGSELRASDNVTVLFNANLLEIETSDGKDHVTALRCATMEGGPSGRDFHVAADAYALAMGGIENVRLLKLSGELGNNHQDHLGRGFMLHPLIETAARVRFSAPVPAETRNFFRSQQVRLKPESYAPVTQPLVNPELLFDYHVFDTWGVLLPTEETLRREQIVNFRVILRFSEDPAQAEVNINWEQVPNEESTISLNTDVPDPIFGQPTVHIDWRLREEEKRTAVRALELCAEYLTEVGATEFELLTELDGGAESWTFPPSEFALTPGDHHMGATRMSDDPAQGVVDADSRLHSIDNLYVAGCSVFPTSGFANPTLTIVALALRMADRMAERARR